MTRSAVSPDYVPERRPTTSAVPRRTHGLLVTGSLRADSNTRALGEALVLEQPWLRLGPSLDRLPFYDADTDAFGAPATVTEFRDRVRVSALLVVVTPDYDGAVPGLVANAADWLSRQPVPALRGTLFLVVSAGTDDQGGTPAAAALADRLTRAGGVPLAPPVAVPHVDEVLKTGVLPAELDNLAGRTRAAVRSRQRLEARSAPVAAPRVRTRRAA